MGNTTDDSLSDYLDLQFDLEPHREAIKVMASYGFSHDTIRAALKARDLVHVRMRSCKFSIGLTDDMSNEGERPPKQRYTTREVIYQSPDTMATQQVRNEVEHYFLRHFPGRYLTGDPESSSLKADAEKFVYVALFVPST